jgi:hypothetical protein
MHQTPTARWTPPTAEPHRVRHIRRRFGLSPTAAALLASLIWGDA